MTGSCQDCDEAVTGRTPPEFILAASSARFLAEAAVNAGCRVATVDVFADDDTRALTGGDSRCVAWGACGPDVAETEAVLSDYPGAALVVGPGFDGAADMLERVTRDRDFYGNSPEVFRACADPAALAAALDALDIERPGLPEAEGLCVTKTPGASGGGHVRIESSVASVPGVAGAQSYLPGTAVSCLFLADGRTAYAVGFNTLWVSTHADGFHYGGAVNRAPLDEEQQRHLSSAVEGLTAHFGLRGLNSLDCVLAGGRLYCIELNPRPSATMQLYESGGLFKAHLETCRGAAARPETSDKVRAHAVVYALCARELSAAECAHPGVCDATAGRSVAAGEPLCSVLADGDSVSEALFALQSMIRWINRTETI